MSNELPYLSRSFDNIYIFSVNGTIDSAPLRRIPSNAKVYPLNSTTSKFKYIKYILKGLLSGTTEFSVKRKDIKKMLASIYLRGRGAHIADLIYRILKKEHVQLEGLVLYSFWFTYHAIAAVLLKKKLTSEGFHVKAFSRAHGYDLYWERSAINYQPYQDVLLYNLNFVFPCSDYGKEYLLQKYPWAAEKIIVSKLGTIDHGINQYNNQKVFATCCNIEPLKRMDLFAKAFCILAKNNPTIEWVCIGDGEQYSIVKEIIRNSPYASQVLFYGRLKNEEVLNLYKHKGIMFFCNVSTTEGLPVSIMEAESFGIPIIATDVGGTKEVINDSCGILLQAEINENQLAAAMQKALDMEVREYENMRINARSLWERESNASQLYEEFCGVLVG